MEALLKKLELCVVDVVCADTRITELLGQLLKLQVVFQFQCEVLRSVFTPHDWPFTQLMSDLSQICLWVSHQNMH
jgi:hypothetical protein